MKTLIVANWKMNPSTKKEAKKLFDSVRKSTKGIKNIEVVICPPFVYLSLFSGLKLGAQNVFYLSADRQVKKSGAFTGEVSPLMLKDLGVEYVIIGHSESRKYLNETDEVINKKIKESLLIGLKPILCVGETDEEKNSGKKLEVLEVQITQALKGVMKSEAKNIVIAYEPVWAIGTGNNCSVDETMSSILLIRKIISKLYNREIADTTKIIYGGSVDSKNTNSYITQTGVNGLLVGGASLNAEEFIEIIKSL
ncbi:MAG: Triosephosphate isomerase [Parcubacteria group bacterium GW2011_GWA2_33_14]|uniref:Triosephosphate isomerase n=1 Tax=Candidatus Staskawiczbacteria bacterium RIFCSPHIGHO2_02_FULL_33_16 TaxID=1802204 RepID=A0A1G2HTB2_9BACT|nr:MAG: Triosephosphate isomerase [Parcubacteria group bacterium GW2011_GWA2_33_14]OGZ65786.1 MAG: triose-phosphate isomerase [Candidatus Staskawiczbacteria bacterium RIFCSPHIGHO2_02_FULL_33_16]OGZ70041.1 MAG: triose-phosphate isomerase [Candidatus Staskawiczbacteria bacterium RIFCSPLOWO2_01_FULL_33_13]